MKFKFNYKSLIISIILIIIEIFVEKTTGFIRYTIGDFLGVILLFYFLKSFIKTSTEALCYTVFIISYSLEALQAISFLKWFNLEENNTARIILGATFSFSDLVAYTFGLILVYFIEKLKLTPNFS